MKNVFERTIRIINKNSEGALLKVAGQTMRVDWETMKEQYDISADGRTCTLNAKTRKKFEEVDELVNFAVISLREAEVAKAKGESPRLETMARLGSLIQKIAEILGCTDGQAMNTIRNQYDRLFGAGGIMSGFDTLRK